MSGKPWSGKIPLVLALVLGIDQLARWGVAWSLWQNTAFFDAIVAEGDLSRRTVAQSLQRTGQALYQDCRWHRVYLIYRVRTCFSLNKADWYTIRDAAGVEHRALELYYWPPRSLMGRVIPEAWLDEVSHREEIVLRVSEDRSLRKWARQVSAAR
ncbi:MAG: hypothetical protein AB7U46_15645 [Paenirhodobacter sp.]|uniref:hypothetical protein n=1 Tax=Paenirhodobacter sp. TaxID=1965326 RepID=UPI003D0F65AF